MPRSKYSDHVRMGVLNKLTRQFYVNYFIPACLSIQFSSRFYSRDLP
jgi:hypothetical protein